MRAFRDIGRRAARLFTQFLNAKNGNVSMVFGLTAIVLLLGGGAGIDWSRAMVTKSRLAAALDAAGLAVGTTSGLTTDQMQALAQKYFDANFPVGTIGTPSPVQVTTDGQSLWLTVTAQVPTTLLKLANIDNMNLFVSNQIVRAVTKLRVALVLDNTGSMSESDSTGTTKMSALKTATHQLLTQLQAAALNPGDVQVALIPFALDVNLGTSNVNAGWINWANWEAAPPNSAPSTSVGPGSNCPYGTSTSPYGYRCQVNATNGSSTTSTIPASGLICPAKDNGNYNTGRGGHYYNGCYDSTLVSSSSHTVCTGYSCSCGYLSNCSCTGSYSSTVCTQTTNTYSHTWTFNNHSTWAGCIMDRDQNYDTNNTTPSSGSTLFPAENADACPPATITPLSYNWTNLNNAVDTMTPNGNTNQTIGFVWGWQALTLNAPLDAPAYDNDTSQVVIILSDGANTQNRWSTSSSSIDSRETTACANAKAAGVIIYTLFVDTGGSSGNSAPLQSCASDSSKYFDLTQSGQIVSAFNQIGTELANLHLAQ